MEQRRDGGFGSSSRGGFGSGRGGFGASGGFGSSGSSRSSSSSFYDSSNSNAATVKPSTEPIKKAFYEEHPDVAAMSAAEVDALRRQNKMHIRGSTPSVSIPRPIRSFEHVEKSVGSQMLKSLVAKLGFSEPTFIQAQGWPVALSGTNMVGIAQTGSGKTLSFTLPAVVHILANRPKMQQHQQQKTPLALVLAPTRELACQIEGVVKDVCGVARGLAVSCVYGGVPKGPQIRALRMGVDMLVATPGRLLDFMDAGLVDVSRVSFLVLDEADRMLDMGFEPQIRRILAGGIRADRQTLFWSATWPKAVQRLAHDILGRDFVQVTIGNPESSLTANKRIRQSFSIVADESQKEMLLADLLARIHEHGPSAEPPSPATTTTTKKKPESLSKAVMPRIIIFVNKKRIADDLARKAYAEGYAVDALHGDKLQPERDAILAAFKSGQCPLLIATDVAARGLDVRDVRVVINYDMPADCEDYVHRIGRTARGAASEEEEKESAFGGHSFTLWCAATDKSTATDLVKLLEAAEQPVPEDLRKYVRGPPTRSFNSRFSRGGNSGRGGFSRGGSGFGGRGGRFTPYR